MIDEEPTYDLLCGYCDTKMGTFIPHYGVQNNFTAICLNCEKLEDEMSKQEENEEK